jgi:hypothetical protein
MLLLMCCGLFLATLRRFPNEFSVDFPRSHPATFTASKKVLSFERGPLTFTGLYLYAVFYIIAMISGNHVFLLRFGTVLSVRAATHTRPVFHRPLANLHLPVSSAQLRKLWKLLERLRHLARPSSLDIRPNETQSVNLLLGLSASLAFAVLASEFLVFIANTREVADVCV